MEKEIAYPIRINKYLALKNICSRREADKFISEKKVLINNRMAVLGDQVNENDCVKIKELDKKNVYLAYNKPRGIVTHSPQKGEKSIEQVFKFPSRVFPLGRLDKDSHGLIILTNDGRITDKLLNPDGYHEKEYRVKIDKKITPSFIREMSGGVVLDDGYKTRPCQAKKIDDFSFSIILTEGKKRQIRRMCESLGKTVLDLRRDRIMNIKLTGLRSGKHREIKESELAELLRNIGL